MAIKHFLFIRHGKTQGNRERRYIGNLNEPLCCEGIREIEDLACGNTLPPIMTVMSGSALRCRQTAEILFPDYKYTTCTLVEIDFGVFKGKNADDLLADKDYEAWLETNCMGDIPGGDSVVEFKKRCCETFKQIAETSNPGTTALVIHGGNIMAILEQYALPKRDFYDYHIKNGESILCHYENGSLYILQKGGVV